MSGLGFTSGDAVRRTTPSYTSQIFLPTKQTTRGRWRRSLRVSEWTLRRISRVDSSVCWGDGTRSVWRKAGGSTGSLTGLRS